MDKIKVFLDDVRKPPPGWILVKWPKEAIKLLKLGGVEEISLDHDLGDEKITGYDVILWIEEKVMKGFEPPIIKVHSANVSARKKMEAGIKNIMKLRNMYYG